MQSQLIQVFRNSLGDINVPVYEYWQLRREKSQETFDDVVTQIIWAIFFINEILMLIVLLNFLIAIVSESYTYTNEIRVQFNYALKAELNQETFLQIKLFSLICPRLIKFEPFNVYTLEEEANKLPDDDDQFERIVDSFKNEMSSVHGRLDAFDRKFNDMGGKLDNICYYVKSIADSIERKQQNESQELDINENVDQMQSVNAGKMRDESRTIEM